MTKHFYMITLPLIFLAASCAEAQNSNFEPSQQVVIIQQSDGITLDALSIVNSPEYAPIFDRLTVLIKQEIPAEEQFRYLGNDERKGYLQQIKENHTPRRSKFRVILDLNDGEGEELIKRLPADFTDIHDTILSEQLDEDLAAIDKSLELFDSLNK